MRGRRVAAMPAVMVIVASVLVGGCRTTSATSASTTTAPTALAPNATVTRIVDGDTIDVEVDGRRERVRLIGIDTPEVAHAASGDRPGNAAECFADASHAFITSLLPIGTGVRLERDVVGRDDYGRLLAYVYRAADGVFVNYEIVRQGYAEPLSIAPNVTFRDRMVEAARAAERAGLGLWSACR